MKLLHRRILIFGALCLSVPCFISDAIADYELTRGRRLIRDHGLQIQSLVYPTGFSDVDLWQSANFTTYNFWQWTNIAVLDQLPADQQWARQYETNFPFTKYLDYREEPRSSSLVRYQYGDELTDLLSPDRLSDMAATYEEWRELYPNAIVHTNSHESQLTASELATYMQAAEPDMIMFDYYPSFAMLSPTRDRWYSVMQTYRLAGLAGNDGTGTAPIPYAQFLRLYRDGYDEPKPSESYIRLQQFASWAFGYSMVDGFIYTHIGSPVETLAAVMFDSEDDSMPNEVFEYVKETNRQSGNLGPALVRMVSTDIRMIRGRIGTSQFTLPSGISEWGAGTADTGGYDDYITSIQPTVSEGGADDTTHGDALVGYFNPLQSSGNESTFTDGLHFMLVNGAVNGTAAEAAQWFRLTFDFLDTDFDSLVRLSRETGEVELVVLPQLSGSEYFLDLHLPGGTGDLFSFWNSSNPLPAIPEPHTCWLISVGALCCCHFVRRVRLRG